MTDGASIEPLRAYKKSSRKYIGFWIFIRGTKLFLLSILLLWVGYSPLTDALNHWKWLRYLWWSS